MSTLKQYVVSFVLGAFIMALYGVYLTYFNLPTFISNGPFVAPALEELMKFTSALFLIYVLKVSPDKIYLSSMGFGFYEQFDHFAYSFGTFSFVPIVMHTVSGIVMGHFLAKALKESGAMRYKYFSFAFLVGVTVHDIFNVLPSVTLRILWVVLFGFLIGV